MKLQSNNILQERYKTNSETGLTLKEAEHRLAVHGANTLPEAKQETLLTVFIRQFKNPLIYLLCLAALIIFFLGENKLDAFIILGVLCFNAVIGTIQEGRTHSILQTLKRFIATSSIVIRDGRKILTDDSTLVPGDIIILQEGQKVPADAYVLEAYALQIDEAILTGESTPVYKTVFEPAEDNAHEHILYKGTHILSGTGKALVFATGAETEIGKINKDIEEIDTDMPLKHEIDRLAFYILIGVVSICLLFFIMGLIAGLPIRELAVMLTALFICVVPEGLPVVMVLVLVTGVYRMAKENVLIKRLQAVEGLGRTDVIVVDKTGTLTRNELIVSTLVTPQQSCIIQGEGYYIEGEVTCAKPQKIQDIIDITDTDIQAMTTAALLLNTSEITYDAQHRVFDIKGDPTEAAMAVCAEKLGFDDIKLSLMYKKLYEIPFDPQHKYHAGFFDHNGSGICFIIGAPEVIMSLKPLTALEKACISLLNNGLRVLAVASTQFPSTLFEPDQSPEACFKTAQDIVHQNTLSVHGLFGIQDTIRPEVPAMVRKAHEAGLRIIMATGDHPDTALHVARATGIYQGNQDGIMTGKEFDATSDEEMLSKLNNIVVYARLLPQQKLRLIQLFHKKGKTIAMTGDGVNDAPALAAADLGIAMGGIGSEVAKAAADIVLFDDSFANIMHAVAQGRHIFYTLKRVILYFFATNLGEVLIVLFALLLMLSYCEFPLPLTAAQILWLNLVTDGFLDISLSMEPQEAGLLHKEQLTKKRHLIDAFLVAKIFFYAIPMAIGSLWIFIRYYQSDLHLARTMALVTMAMYQWFNAWNCRSESSSLLTIGLCSNRWLLLATSFVLFLQLLLVYAPFMQYIFKTVPLTLDQWLLIIGITAPIVLIDEVRKAIVRANRSARS